MASSIDDLLAQLGRPSADRDYRPGHARMHALLDPLQLARPRLRVRIAGTNGKGSTAWMLAAALQAVGLRVGLYTSPHLHAFHERIRIDGQPIPDAALRRILARLLPRAQAIGASYFETATAAALEWFASGKVDVEILEAGVGARLDATTAVPADLALITPIALDHREWLGDTLPAIAAEKAHAMDGCRWALSSLQAPDVEQVLRQHRPGLRFVAPEDWTNLASPGAHQRQNASLAWHALLELADGGQIPRRPQAWRQAIAALAIPGRLQCLRLGDCEIWLDAAHNLHAIEALLPWIQDRRWDAILVFPREDRNLDPALPRLQGLAARLIGSQAPWPVIRPDAVTAVRQEIDAGARRLLVLGSFTTVAAVSGALPS